MKRLTILLLFSALVGIGSSADHNIHDPFTADLKNEMRQLPENGLLRINIRLNEQFDTEKFLVTRSSLSKDQRRNYLLAELKTISLQSQQPVIDLLNGYAKSGKVNRITPLWISNVINCYASKDVINRLAGIPSVESIDIDEERILIDSMCYTGPHGGDVIGSREIAYHVQKVNAPDVWALGFKGQGVLVGFLDSGVNYHHGDLAGNLWTHPDYPFHGWNFVSNNNNPLDDNGHGTHCAGILAGTGASGTQTGVAPNATLMVLKILNSQGSGAESDAWSAIQFAIEHGADVLSMSLGWLHSWNPDRKTWRNVMVNTLTAGVIAAVGAGNEGNLLGVHNLPDNIRTPADCPPPWLHPSQTIIGGKTAVVCVGATNSADTIASNSARGPVTWLNIPGYRDYPYNPGIGLIRPDIVAPGVNVKSLRFDNNTGYILSSGTSMATPCVAGIMALMLSKNPITEPALVSQILEETAHSIASGKSNMYGSGRVNALAAVNAISSPGPYYYSHVFNDTAGNNDGNINPGEAILLSLGLINPTGETINDVNVSVSVNSPYISMIDCVEFFGDFNAGGIVFKELAFKFVVAGNMPNKHQVRFKIKASSTGRSWESHFIATGYTPVIESGKLIVLDPAGNANNRPDPGEEIVIQIPVFNTGKMAAADARVVFTTTSPYINLAATEINIGDIDAEGMVNANLRATILPFSPVGTKIVFGITASSGVFSCAREYSLRVGPLIEDFESADFSSFDWAFSGNQPWSVTSQNSVQGIYSARSGTIEHNSTSAIELNMNVAKDGDISFFFKVSSETDHDFLRFFIGNTLMGQWSGEVPWTTMTYPVAPGPNIFRWEYLKDAAILQGIDAAWIDMVSLPQQSVTAAFAGDDASICQGSSHQLAGVGMNFTALGWTSSGSGVFSNPTITNPVYIPSATDILTGTVRLTLSVKNQNNIVSSDFLTLSIKPQALVWAGNDTVLCSTDIYFTGNARASNFSTLEWSSSGSGIFGNPGMLHTTYFPGTSDVQAGQVTLTLTAQGLAPCNLISKSILVKFLAMPQPPGLTGPDTIQVALNPTTTFTITPGMHASNHEWQLMPASAGILSVTGTALTINWSTQSTGQVIVLAKSKNECGESAWTVIKIIFLSNITGLNDSGLPLAARLFPNPSSGLFTLDVQEENGQILSMVVYNLRGQKVFEKQIIAELSSSASVPLDLRHLDVGLYILQVVSGQSRAVIKLIIRK